MIAFNVEVSSTNIRVIVNIDLALRTLDLYLAQHSHLFFVKWRTVPFMATCQSLPFSLLVVSKTNRTIVYLTYVAFYSFDCYFLAHATFKHLLYLLFHETSRIAPDQIGVYACYHTYVLVHVGGNNILSYYYCCLLNKFFKFLLQDSSLALKSR